MKKTLIFKNGKKRTVKSEEGRYYHLSDGTMIRKSNPDIVEVKEADVKAEETKTEEYPQNFLDEMPDEDKELFGNIPEQEIPKPICYVPTDHPLGILPEKKASKSGSKKKTSKKGE